jgi:hypothetical protein
LRRPDVKVDNVYAVLHSLQKFTTIYAMYAKLFSRITESSLMEESINVRYVFVMLLAIADPKAHVIGTDVAIARRINIPLEEFQLCVEALMRPDPNSNSEEEEGRRLVRSTEERGYRIVNYLTYRNFRDEEHRREYMRGYMKDYRSKTAVNSGKQGKPRLAQAEALGISNKQSVPDDGSSPPAPPGNANADATPTAGEVSGQEGPTPEASGGAKEPKQAGEGGGSGKGGSIDPGATSSDSRVDEVLDAYPKKNSATRAAVAQAIAERGFDEVMDRTRLWVDTYAGRHQFLPNAREFFGGRFADDPPEQRVDPFMLKRQLEALDEAILDCAGNPDSLRYTRDDCTPALRREYQALLARRKKMLLG